MKGLHGNSLIESKNPMDWMIEDFADRVKNELRKWIGTLRIPEYKCEYNDGKADGYEEVIKLIDAIRNEGKEPITWNISAIEK